MLFTQPLTPSVSSPTLCASNASLQYLLAYEPSLKDCQIGVEFSVDGVVLTGTATSRAAVRMAMGLAAAFTSGSVRSYIQVMASDISRYPVGLIPAFRGHARNGNVIDIKGHLK